MLILRFQTNFQYCIMFTKERHFKQVPTSKNFILEKSLSLWICKRSLPGKIIVRSLLYCNIDARSIQFLSKLSIAPIYRCRFKQFIFIPADFTILLTSPEAATRVVLYKKLLLKISQYSQENTCVEASFIKRRFQRRCFPVNIAKCLRTPILKNNCKWLLVRLTLRSHPRVPP